MHLDWTLSAAGPATLVRVRLRNERATDRRVRLQNCLDGPVLPPRRHGTPEAGWDRAGVETVVPAGETAALGYACPAPEAEPPVVVEEVGPTRAADERPTPAAAVRELGDHRPPRDVLGGSNQPKSTASPTPAEASGVDGTDPATPAANPSPPPLPDDADALLDRYRTRIETAETLAVAGVPEATAILRENGGLAGVETLADELDSDARALRALAAAASTLAARAVAATPPTETLRRLS